MFAKLLTALTVASVGGMIGVGLVNEYSAKPIPSKAASATPMQSPSLRQAPPGPPDPADAAKVVAINAARGWAVSAQQLSGVSMIFRNGEGTPIIPTNPFRIIGVEVSSGRPIDAIVYPNWTPTVLLQ